MAVLICIPALALLFSGKRVVAEIGGAKGNGKRKAVRQATSHLLELIQ